MSKHKISAIVNTSWGGLVEPKEYPSHIHFVNNIPYDLILSKAYDVIHHGGSGTTHSALINGCPNLIVAHFIDQFYWNRIIHKLKLSPKGVSIKKMNKDNFEALLLDLLDSDNYKKNAVVIAEQIRKENNTEKLVRFTLE